jgi:CRP-like cAMP-binding protein
MLEQLIGIIDVLNFNQNEIIFREKEPSDRFYMVKTGKVLLEQRMSDKVTVCVGSIKPGLSFGWSAMLDNETYTVDAVCDEPCLIYSVKRNKIKKVFEMDPEMGFRIHQRLLVILKKRLDHRTEQFRQAIMHHPAMQNLFL